MADNKDTPLHNLGVLVTRPELQGASLAQAITKRGGQPLLFPTVAIHARDDDTETRRTLAQVRDYDITVFVSPNAVRYGLELLGDQRGELDHTGLAAVGGATAQQLRDQGYTVDIVPPRGAGSEALLEHGALQKLAQQRVLIVRGVGGRELLADTLAPTRRHGGLRRSLSAPPAAR